MATPTPEEIPAQDLPTAATPLPAASETAPTAITPQPIPEIEPPQ